MSADPLKDRRRLKRAVERIPAAFQAGEMRGTGYIKNVTKQGLFVRTDDIPTPLAPVRVIFHNRDGGKIEVVGSVRWTTDQLPPDKRAKGGFGMLIEVLAAEFLDFYEQILVR